MKVRSEEKILSAAKRTHTSAEHNPDPGSKSKKRGKKLVLSSKVKIRRRESFKEQSLLPHVSHLFHVTLSMNRLDHHLTGGPYRNKRKKS